MGARSPLTGAFGAAEVGGHWGAQFKRAGFDALIIEGVSSKPVYLWIKDGEVEIRGASHLCGENMVRFACVMNGLKDAAGRTGMGAVMGSKKLKAVAALDMDTIRGLAGEMARAIRDGEKGGNMHRYGTGVGIDSGVVSGNLPIRNFRNGEFPGAGKLSADSCMEESHFLYSQRPGISVDEVCRIREKEAFACAEVIGAEGRMLGFADNPLSMTPGRMEILAQEIRDFKPDIILTHWKDELTYPTHWLTSNSALRAAQMANVRWNIRFFEPNIGTAGRVGFVPDHYVDISDVFD